MTYHCGTIFVFKSICLIINLDFKIVIIMADLKGRVLAGKILVKPEDAVEKTAGGLYIPDSAKEKPLQGEVVLVGAGKKDEPMEIAVGDVICYGKYGSTELVIDGVSYVLMSQSDVLYIN